MSSLPPRGVLLVEVNVDGIRRSGSLDLRAVGGVEATALCTSHCALTPSLLRYGFLRYGFCARQADLLMCNSDSGYNYGQYFIDALGKAGVGSTEIAKIKIWNSGFPKEPEKGLVGCQYVILRPPRAHPWSCRA